MRAFNLIPADERGGGGVSAGKSGGSAFVVLGLLGVLAIFALLYGQASRQISSQTSKIATLNAQAQTAQRAGGQTSPVAPSRERIHLEGRYRGPSSQLDAGFAIDKIAISPETALRSRLGPQCWK